MKRISLILTSILLLVSMSLSSCNYITETVKDVESAVSSQLNENDDNVSSNSDDDIGNQQYDPKDDFYDYVNGEWISEQVLDGNSPSHSHFQDIANESFTEIYFILTQAVSLDVDKGDDDLAKLTKFYKTAMDYTTRNSDGTAPIVKYAEKIKSISSIEEAQLVAAEQDIDMIGSFMMFGISPDKEDSTMNRLYLSGPTLSFGDKSYYTDESERGQAIIDAYKELLKKLFVLAGESDTDAVNMAESAFNMEKELAGSTYSSYESMDDSLTYNKFDLDEFSAQYQNFDVKTFLSRVKLENPEFIIVTEPNYYAKLDEVMVAENLEGIKNFMYAQMLVQTSDFLTNDHLRANGDFTNVLSGTTGYRDDIDEALSLTQDAMGELIGKVYVENFFSHDAKDEVEEMTYTIIDAYKKRINKLEWMSDETKASAIKKLDTMSVKVGYPDVWEDYSNLEVSTYEEGGSLLENVINNYHFTYEDFINDLDKPIDRNQWNMNAQTANAYYNPSLNEIVFPAGILKAPFFDLEATESQNYGAIGSIIAHEVSHAFDESGSKYDEYGNLANWWTDTDRQNYEGLTKKLAELFDGYEILPEYSVDGYFTLDENIADLGGMSCITEIVGELPDGNFDEMFESFATIWGSKSTDEHKINLLIQDSHAPDKLRVNLILPNIDQFYETYGVTDGDGMFFAKEDRIQIW